MVASPSAMYAQIVDGLVHWLFTAAELPEWNPNNIQVVDITAVTPRPLVGWSYSAGVFSPPAPPSLAAVSSAQLTSLNKACEAQILAGFSSTALGAAYTYPSNTTDQLNLSGTIQRSMLPGVLATDLFPFTCADAAGVWAFRPHTPAQIQQVGKDAYAAILAARVKNKTLQDQVAAATSITQVQGVIW